MIGAVWLMAQHPVAPGYALLALGFGVLTMLLIVPRRGTISRRRCLVRLGNLLDSDAEPLRERNSADLQFNSARISCRHKCAGFTLLRRPYNTLGYAPRRFPWR